MTKMPQTITNPTNPKTNASVNSNSSSNPSPNSNSKASINTNTNTNTDVSFEKSIYPWHRQSNTLFTFEVTLTDGPMTEEFCAANQQVSRTIVLPGKATLAKLHEAIFKAFDRSDPHLYEFQIGGILLLGKDALHYIMPEATVAELGSTARDAGVTSIDSLSLKEGSIFLYRFDFGDDWIHRIKVTSINIGPTVPVDQYPKISNRIGASPPQYPNWDS